MKKRLINYSFTCIKVLGDIAIINGALILGYAFKFKLYLLNPYINSNLPLLNPRAQVEPYISVLMIYTLLMMTAIYFSGVYSQRNGIFAEIDEFIKITKGVAIGVVEVMAFTFIYRGFPQSRYVLLYAGGFTVLFMSIYHVAVIRVQKHLRAKGVGSKSVLIVGADTMGQSLAERIVKNPNSGLHLLGFVDEKNPEKVSYNINDHFRLLGKPGELEALLSAHAVDKVIVTTTEVVREEMEHWYQLCETYGVEFQVIPDYLELMTTTVRVSEIDGIPIISIKSIRRSFVDRVLKRALDLAFSGLLIALTSPLWLVTVLVIKLTSRGPVFFVQERIGLNRKPFLMYKFRSMRTDAEKLTGPKIVTREGDSRVTPIGRLIRKYSIDELPQLLNVLKGDMSIVGPRPEREFFIKRFEKEYPGFSNRLLVKPGITGWAQINGRAALSSRIEEKLRYDLYYIENWSVLFDIKIILKTVFKVIGAREAF